MQSLIDAIPTKIHVVELFHKIQPEIDQLSNFQTYWHGQKASETDRHHLLFFTHIDIWRDDQLTNSKLNYKILSHRFDSKSKSIAAKHSKSK